MRIRVLAAALVLVPAISFAQGTPAATPAAPSPLKRTILLTQKMVTQPTREETTAFVELAVGGSAPLHLHTGEEIGYVVEGEAVVEMQGAEPKVLKAGDAYFVPPNTPHLVRNTGKTVWKAVSIYLIETGKPLAVTVTKP